MDKIKDNSSVSKKLLVALLAVYLLSYGFFGGAQIFSAIKFFLIIIIFIWIILGENIYKVMRFRPLELLLFLMLIIVVFGSFFTSGYKLSTFLYSCSFMFLLLISKYTAGKSSCNNSLFLVFIKSMSLLSFLSIIIGLLINIINPSLINYRGGNIALTGIFSNNNTFGFVNLIFLLTTFYLILINKENMKRISMMSIGILISTISILLSGSRASILSYLIFLMLLWMFYFKLIPKIKSALLLLILLFILYLFIDINTLFQSVIRFESESSDLSSSREDLLLVFWKYKTAIPILGYGLGEQESIWSVANIDSSFLYLSNFGFHNSYIQIFIETGIIGFILFGIIFFSAILKSSKSTCVSMKEFKALKIIIVSISIYGFFESTLFSPGNPLSFLFWVILFRLIQLKKKGGL